MMRNKIPTVFIALFVLSILLVQGCQKHYFRSNYRDANKLIHDNQTNKNKLYLKAHLKNGDICILKDTWEIDTIQDLLVGNGSQYDFNRNIVSMGKLSIPIDSVIIFETNKPLNDTETGRIAALSVLAGLDATLGIFCFSYPKACFGSCPTFYIDENDDFHYADAEGFSNAIMPTLEYYDIDALKRQTIIGNKFSITMKNEAQETHCVNNVKLLVYPIEGNEKIYHSPDNTFYKCKNNYKLNKAFGEEGDITSLLSKADRQERFSLADETNMRSKEEIILTFDNVGNKSNLGLITGFRQTMMTTYIIYSAMGYMGDEISDFGAKMAKENNAKNALKNSVLKELGNIDIYVWNNNKWEIQSDYSESGPIAFNHQIMPINTKSNDTIKIKIVLNKGLWRLDYFGLTNIISEVKPIELYPDEIISDEEINTKALSKILSPTQYLISMPGNKYKFNFALPKENQKYDMFLYSKGYYLEWMRNRWIKEKNFLKLYQMINLPKLYLKSEAKSYKEYEETMEEAFWGSKINNKILSYHEK